MNIHDGKENNINYMIKNFTHLGPWNFLIFPPKHFVATQNNHLK